MCNVTRVRTAAEHAGGPYFQATFFGSGGCGGVSSLPGLTVDYGYLHCPEFALQSMSLTQKGPEPILAQAGLAHIGCLFKVETQDFLFSFLFSKTSNPVLLCLNCSHFLLF